MEPVVTPLTLSGNEEGASSLTVPVTVTWLPTTTALLSVMVGAALMVIVPVAVLLNATPSQTLYVNVRGPEEVASAVKFHRFVPGDCQSVPPVGGVTMLTVRG